MNDSKGSKKGSGLSRREFLKGSGAAVAATAMATTVEETVAGVLASPLPDMAKQLLVEVFRTGSPGSATIRQSPSSRRPPSSKASVG